jgi:hypothetical protein
MPQRFLIVQIFIAQSQTVDPLANHLPHFMGDVAGVALIPKTRREAPDRIHTSFGLTQQQSSAIGADLSSSKIGISLYGKNGV